MLKSRIGFNQMIVMIILILMVTLIAQLGYNLSRGYVLLAPSNIKEFSTLKTFQSELKPISIDYPENWRAVFNLYQGDGRDKEAIAQIKPVGHNYPYLQIAYRRLETTSLETIADWGEERITNPIRNVPRILYKTDSLENLEVDDQQILVRQYHYIDYTSERINCIHTYLLDAQDSYIIEMCVNEESDSPELQILWLEMIKSISLRP